MKLYDVAVIGGGPAGLAVAIGSALRGLSVVLFERRQPPLDKACGEGIMPQGLAALERLGVLRWLDLRDTAPITGIHYLQEDGAQVTGALPAPGGLGVRRLALSAAMLARAAEVGVELRLGEGVQSLQRTNGVSQVVTAQRQLTARFVVGADGLGSRLGRQRGWAGPAPRRRRLGLRQHFALAPWTSLVEVHFAEHVEAYVTPAGAARVGVAFLWDEDRLIGQHSFPELLDRFPVLRARLDAAPADSRPRGSGPLHRRMPTICGDGFALVGDAAGYVDAITGEGISLALTCAAALCAALPEALSGAPNQHALRPYVRMQRQSFFRYAVTTELLLILAVRPWLRRRILQLLARFPRLFALALRLVMGSPTHTDMSSGMTKG